MEQQSGPSRKKPFARMCGLQPDTLWESSRRITPLIQSVSAELRDSYGDVAS